MPGTVPSLPQLLWNSAGLGHAERLPALLHLERHVSSPRAFVQKPKTSLSSSISSISMSPGSMRGNSSSLASGGRLKLVLLLELPLPGRPEEEDGLPVLESDVLREDIPDASASVGDSIMGESGWMEGVPRPLRSRFGISAFDCMRCSCG